MRRSIKISLQGLLESLLVIAIILNCNTVYSAAADFDLHLNELIAILSVGLTLLAIMEGKISRRIMNRWLWVFAVYFLMVAAYFAFSVPIGSALGYVSRFVVFIPFIALYLSFQAQYGQMDRLIDRFVGILEILSVISLFFWFFGSELHLIHPNMSVTANWGQVYTYPGYFGLYFERQTIELFKYNGFRNAGLFAEGPMYAFCLTVAIAALLFLDRYSMNGRLKRKTKRMLVVFVISLITTISLTGYVMIAAFAFVKFITYPAKDRLTNGVKILVSLFVLVIGGLAVFVFLVEKQQSVSWLIRMDDIQAGFRAWMDAPLLGNGYGSYAVEKYMSAFRWWNMGFSSALFSILSQGGLVLLSVYFFAFGYGIRCARKTVDKGRLFFIGVVIVEFVISSVHYSFLMLFLISYCYALFLVKNSMNSKNLCHL